MCEHDFHNEISQALDQIQRLLDRSVGCQEKIQEIQTNMQELEKEGTSNLVQSVTASNTLADQRTGMAQERTALVREQTRLSTRSTELATIRTDLAQDRTSLAGQRTDLAAVRSQLSRARTNLAFQRTEMAADRTRFSRVRTELSRGRTFLALVRTGLAFLTLSVGFYRFFGPSWWSIFDGLIALFSLTLTISGLLGYRRTCQTINNVEQAVIPSPDWETAL